PEHSLWFALLCDRPLTAPIQLGSSSANRPTASLNLPFPPGSQLHDRSANGRFSMNDRKPHIPAEIDDTEDRMGSIEQLDFSDRKDERKGRIGDAVPEDQSLDEFPPERVEEAGMTGGEIPDGEPTMDDMSPETLIPQDGARSAGEAGHGGPADQDLSVVSEHRIGADVGLD